MTCAVAQLTHGGPPQALKLVEPYDVEQIAQMAAHRDCQLALERNGLAGTAADRLVELMSATSVAALVEGQGSSPVKRRRGLYGVVAGCKVLFMVGAQ